VVKVCWRYCGPLEVVKANVDPEVAPVSSVSSSRRSFRTLRKDGNGLVRFRTVFKLSNFLFNPIGGSEQECSRLCVSRGWGGCLTWSSSDYSSRRRRGPLEQDCETACEVQSVGRAVAEELVLNDKSDLMSGAAMLMNTRSHQRECCVEWTSRVTGTRLRMLWALAAWA
jgi:hypothetical protein